MCCARNVSRRPHWEPLIWRTCGRLLKDKDDIRSNWALERTFAPVMEPKDRDRRLKGWKKAVRAALYFANDEEE
ncbi:MAG: hypothetical protein ACLURV_04965 [Gallintestinimicrobium sp.]